MLAPMAAPPPRFLWFVAAGVLAGLIVALLAPALRAWAAPDSP